MVGNGVRRIPPWAWLVAIVVASFAVRAWLARGMLGPFIMVDELIYSELGRSLADSGELLVREIASPGYGIVYPALISPAYAIFDSLTDAYAAVKTLNALVMSLAAIPAFFLARRVVGPGLSLLAAVLAVSLPSLVYTGSVMTENVFYPVFLTAALLLTLMLERPTTARLILLLIAVGLASATRVQAVVLVPALLTAPLLLAGFRREGLRVALRPFRLLYAVVLGAGALVALVPDRAREVALGPARGVQHRRRVRLRAGRGAPLLPVPPRRARSLPGDRAGGGDHRPRGTCPNARPAAAGAPGDRARDDVLARARRLRLRVRVRAADPGAEPLRRRAALSRAPARLGREGSRASARPLAVGCRRGGGARPPHPVRALHRDLGALGHAHAAAVVVGTGSRVPRVGRGARVRAGRRARARRSCSFLVATRSLCPSSSSRTTPRSSTRSGRARTA